MWQQNEDQVLSMYVWRSSRVSYINESLPKNCLNLQQYSKVFAIIFLVWYQQILSPNRKPGFFETKLDQAKFKIIGTILRTAYCTLKVLSLYPAKILE